MTKLLIVCFTFLLSYLSFSTLNQFDSKLICNLYDYYVETTFFTLVVLYILFTFISVILFKIIFLIINIPSNVKDFFFSKRVINDNYLLMQAMAEYITGGKLKSGSLIQKIVYRLSKEKKMFYTLFLAETEIDPSIKLKYFQELEQSKYYSAFVFKRLAQIFYHNNMYKIAENYAVKSFNLNKFDSETLEILLDCYAELSLWTKFVFIVSKLNKIDAQKLEYIKNKIVNYYIDAAKNMLEVDEIKKAIYYLELAIKLVPSHIEALNIYLPLNYSSWNNDNIKKLKIAFADNPCFEIVKLYKKFASIAPSEIYEELAILADPKQYLGLFLAIAAYFDLPEKIKNLKSESELLQFHNIEYHLSSLFNQNR